MKTNKKKYYIKRGYFDTRGKVYIPYWKYLLFKVFTNYALHIEEQNKNDKNNDYVWVTNFLVGVQDKLQEKNAEQRRLIGLRKQLKESCGR